MFLYFCIAINTITSHLFLKKKAIILFNYSFQKCHLPHNTLKTHSNFTVLLLAWPRDQELQHPS